MKRVSIIGVVMAIVISIGVWFTWTAPEKEVMVSPSKSGIINSVVFTCDDAKTIQAIFFTDREVKLIMSDARTMTLPQVISASGARYATVDESFVFWNKGDTAFVTEGATTTFHGCVIKKDTTKTAMENNCIQLDGQLVTDTRGDGKEYTLCSLQDGRACEINTLYNGDCPYGAFKTTGYDTIDQKYCAWLGGRTLAVENSVCTFNNGKTCKTIDLYNGKCDTK